MGFTKVAAVTGYLDAVGTTINCSSALNVAEHDLLVAWCTWQNAETGNTLTVDENDGTDTFQTETVVVQGEDIAGAFAFLLDAPADASFTPRMTIPSGRRLTIDVYQLRPDAGDTVTKEASSTGSGTSTALQSGNITTTGDDEVIFGGGADAGGGTEFANGQIADTAATETINNGDYGGVWYKTFTSAQSNIHAQITNANDNWVCNIISFKAAGDLSIFQSECVGSDGILA